MLAETETVHAVANLLPQSALPLRALAVPFRGDPKARTHPVAVAIEVTASPRDGQPERAEWFAAAVEPGKTLRATHRATTTFGAGAPRLGVSRYLLCERLDLKPGRYQLRLGVKSTWAQATGSVYVDVTVPSFREDVLSMSGLALGLRLERLAVRRVASPAVQRTSRNASTVAPTLLGCATIRTARC